MQFILSNNALGLRETLSTKYMFSYVNLTDIYEIIIIEHCELIISKICAKKHAEHKQNFLFLTLLFVNKIQPGCASV